MLFTIDIDKLGALNVVGYLPLLFAGQTVDPPRYADGVIERITLDIGGFGVQVVIGPPNLPINALTSITFPATGGTINTSTSNQFIPVGGGGVGSEWRWNTDPVAVAVLNDLWLAIHGDTSDGAETTTVEIIGYGDELVSELTGALSTNLTNSLGTG